ncbi:MAG: hypothetical protein AAGI51_03055 [Pseudomonadota bacterium]
MATLRAPRLAAARTPGAILRALLVFALTLAPFLLAGDVGAAARDATLFAGASAALVVLFEYASRTPALVDFRDAKPLNRLRFAMVAGTLLATMAFIRSTPGGGVREAGEALGRLLGGWASPVGMMAESLSRPSALGPDLLAQGAAAVALTSAAILSLLVSALIWFGRWPGPAERFNRFTNLPTFDEADAADAPPRLLRLGLQAIVMALALPAALLALVAIAAWMIEADALSRPLPLAWTVSIWAAASGAQLIRGVALIKLSRVLAAADPA